MTQDLRDKVPPNLPSRFYLMCVKCGRRSQIVRYSLKHGENRCYPNCPKTN
jgi:hypothetical protein